MDTSYPSLPDGHPERPITGGALGRGLRILEELIRAASPLTLSAVASLVHLDISTTSRLLKTLEEAGYVHRDTHARTFGLTPRAVQPLPLLHPLYVVRQNSEPIVHALSQAIKETVLLILFLHRERIIIALSQYPGSLLPYYESWIRNPLYATASGTVLLMTMSEEERAEQIGPGPYMKYGPGTISDFDTLNREIKASEDRGYVLMVDAGRVGSAALAAPIRIRTNQVIGCLVAMGRSSDFVGERVTELARELTKQASLLPLEATSIQQMARFTDRG